MSPATHDAGYEMAEKADVVSGEKKMTGSEKWWTMLVKR